MQDLDHDQGDNYVSQSASDDSIILLLFDLEFGTAGLDLGAFLELTLTTIILEGGSDFDLSRPYSINIGGLDGTAIDFTAVYNGSDVNGIIAGVVVSGDRFVSVFIVADETVEPGVWEDVGEDMFNAMVSGIDFDN